MLSVVHTTRHVFRRTFWLVDMIHIDTHAQTDTLKATPAFAVAAVITYIPGVLKLFVLLCQTPINVLAGCSDLELCALDLGFLLLQSCFSLLQCRLQLVAFRFESLASLVDLVHVSTAFAEPLS